MNEQEFRDKYYQLARQQTIETLPKFISDMFSEKLDYGSACCAVACAALAGAWAANEHPQGGITGFQAGCVMWEFIRHWNFTSNKCGMCLLDYDEMLYPQGAHRFEKTIRQSTYDELVKNAKLSLSTGRGVPNVIEHWQSIVNGEVPFGYKVKND